MRKRFAITSNVQRFLSAITMAETCITGEARWVLVTGGVGYGKSRTLQWWANKPEINAVRLSATPTWTPRRALKALVIELGEAPMFRTDDLAEQAIMALSRSQRPIVIDEAQHTLKRKAEVLDELKDITDNLELPLILVSMDNIQSSLRRFDHLASRVIDAPPFGPATFEDVMICVKTLCEVGVAEDLAVLLLKQTKGRLREIIKALGYVESFGKRNNLEVVTRDDMDGEEIVYGWMDGGKKKIVSDRRVGGPKK